ncbi:MAG: glycosyltransferase [Calditrichaeota bacterium]|nr:MAG: glycosyltransferase [Calditrichota bacterium]
MHLKRNSEFQNTRLLLTGGYTGDDKLFVNQVKKQLADNAMLQDVEIWEEFDKSHRIEFLRSLTMLSVPVLGGEAFGAYQVEALAAGVPIVQPNVGGYAEFIRTTGGGLIYEPNDGLHLSQAWATLLRTPQQLQKLAHQGHAHVHQHFSMEQLAQDIISIYTQVLEDRQAA